MVKNQQDTEVLAALVEAGSDVSQPHDVDFYVYLPSEPAAGAVAAALKEENLTAEVRPAAMGGNWLCLAHGTFVPTIENMGRYRSVIEALVHVHGGEYDGWEAKVVDQPAR